MSKTASLYLLRLKARVIPIHRVIELTTHTYFWDTLTGRMWGIVGIVLMSPFLMETIVHLSFVFIRDWRVVNIIRLESSCLIDGQGFQL